MSKIKQYIDEFNLNDEEIYINDITNEDVYSWIKENVPHLKCPDKTIEKAYYFRWWTYRKHIKKTKDGCVITEFLPKVSWSKKHNTINAAAGHHISEGKWLKNAEEYLNSYINFFLDGNGDAHQYSTWILHSANELWQHVGKYPLSAEVLQKCIEYYERWEKEHKTSMGLFWSYDGYDAMEFTINGTRNMKRTKGLRPTLNSYMYGEAKAIANFAKILGNTAIYNEYEQKAKELRNLINKYLYKDKFYFAVHPENEEFTNIEICEKNNAKELIGYIPWCFAIPEIDDSKAFDSLLDENVFFTEYGLATADKSHPKFLFEYNHECLWNGYVWPFATSQTLNALRNYIFHYSNEEKYKKMYIKLLHQYASMHTKTENGKTVMWIDEVCSPLTGEWSSREILKKQKWPENKGGYERGKDYNHSTFCDLLLSYICGITYEDGVPKFNINIPEGWDSFSIENLHVCGKKYRISYEKRSGVEITSE